MSIVTHIVLFKYKASASSAERHLLASKLLLLLETCVNSDGERYIISCTGGAVNNSPLKSKGYEHGFVLAFPSTEARDYYAMEDQAHIKFMGWAGDSGIIDDVLDFDFAGGVF